MAAGPQAQLVWSREERVSGSGSRTLIEKPSRHRGLKAALAEFTSLASESHGYEAARALAVFREDLLERIFEELGEEMEGEWWLIPEFLSVWRHGIERFESEEDTDVDRCISQEYQHYAETSMLYGSVTQARAALGRGIQLARKRRFVGWESVANEAKAFLLKCVRYQNDLARCERVMARQHTPLPILSSVLDELGVLQELAPYAAEVVTLKATVLLSLHRVEEAVDMISTSPFRSTSSKLRLTYAKALEFGGFYLDSIAVAARSTIKGNPLHINYLSGKEEDSMGEKLADHARHLTVLLEKRAAAEDALVKSNFIDAEKSFTEALSMASPESWKMRAALLLGRANAMIGAERLLSAQSDLRESLRLDPSNPITRLRLRTVELSQETRHIHRLLRR